MRKSVNSLVWRFFRSALLLVCLTCALCGLTFAQTLSVSSEVFNATVQGASAATQTSTFTNNTGGTLSSISVSVTTGSSDYTVATTPSTNCGGSLTSGSACTITTTFTPSTTGARAGIITISWTNSAISPYYILLSGWGTTTTSGFSTEVYTTPLPAASGASISAVTMVTPPVATSYYFGSYLSETVVGSGGTCSTGTTIQVNVIYQDPNAASAQTVPVGLYTVTGAGTLGYVPWTSGAAGWNFRAAANTAVKYSTTFTNGNCTTAPTVQFYPFLEQY